MMLSPTLDLYYKIEKARSQGIDAYSLSNPIFDDEGFNKLLIEPEANLLLPPIGLSPLRIKCSERLFQKWDCTSHETTICAGAKAALFSIFRLCAKNNNGKVIIINPSWPSYFDIVKVSGLSPVGFDTRFDENFSINVDRLGELFKKVNPVAVVLSNPNNPSGKIYDEEELKRICESCQYYGVALVIDESFSRIVFDEKKWFASRVSLDDSIFIVNSLSKNYNLQGFRVAPALIPRESIDQFLAIHQTIAASASSIAQHLSLQIMKQDKNKPSRETKFDESRDIALEALGALNWQTVSSDGTFHLFPFVGKNTEALEHLESKGLFFLDGPVFGQSYSGHLRFCFGKNPVIMKQIICRLLKN